MKSKEINGKLTLDERGELKQAEARLVNILRQENQGVVASINRTVEPNLECLQEHSQSNQKKVKEVIYLINLCNLQMKDLKNQLDELSQEINISNSSNNRCSSLQNKINFRNLEKKLILVLLWCQLSTIFSAIALGLSVWIKIELPQIKNSSITAIYSEKNLVRNRDYP